MTMKNILKITQKTIQIIIKIMEEILAIDSLPKLLISWKNLAEKHKIIFLIIIVEFKIIIVELIYIKEINLTILKHLNPDIFWIVKIKMQIIIINKKI
jgi:hypothetical protein